MSGEKKLFKNPSEMQHIILQMVWSRENKATAAKWVHQFKWPKNNLVHAIEFSGYRIEYTCGPISTQSYWNNKQSETIIGQANSNLRLHTFLFLYGHHIEIQFKFQFHIALISILCTCTYVTHHLMPFQFANPSTLSWHKGRNSDRNIGKIRNGISVVC